MADEKRVGVFNTSKVGRKYTVKGFAEGELIEIVAGKSTEVPESVAKWLLGILAGGKARYPDIVDTSKLSPEATKAKDDALEQNAALLKENASLKAQLAEVSKNDKRGYK